MRKTLLFILLILLAGFFVYNNSYSNAFVWDDHDLIRNNVFVKDWAYLPNILTGHIGEGAQVVYEAYRPLQMVTYMIDYSVWGRGLAGYHLTNILLHVFVALAIYRLLILLFRDRSLALLASLFFVVHPVHVEAVSYVSGRADSLGALFLLAGLISYITCCETRRMYGAFLVPVLYVCALLSRESCLIFPAVLVLYHGVFRKKPRRDVLASVAVISIIYVVFRILFSGQDLPHVRTPVTFLQRIPGVFEALVQYIRILVFPFHLHMEYGYPLFSIRDPKVITGILIVVSLLFLGVRAMRRRSGSIVAFSVLWFFVTLLPASQIYPIPMAYMAEHWLYIPSLGFFLLLAKVLVNMYRKRTLRGVAMVWAPSILLFYAFMTIGYTTYWQAPLALYARTLRFSPGSVRAMGSLANEYFYTGQTEKALPFYEKVIEAKPSSPVVYNNMGLAYISLGRLEEARLLYEEAIEMDPRFADFYNNLGIVYSKRGQHEKAVLFYEKARDLNPYSANAHNNLGKAYESLGRYREAVNAYRIALLHDPDNTVVRKNLKKLRRLVNAAP